MNKYIYALVESFYKQSPTEQMNKTLRDARRAARRYKEAEEARHQFIVNVLGKSMVKRFGDNETFAPIPVNALHITRKDLDQTRLNPETVYDEKPEVLTDKFVDWLGVKYFRNELYLRDNGFEEYLKTDIVIKTPDELIDFFYDILAAYKKTYNEEDTINWKPIVSRFRKYLNK